MAKAVGIDIGSKSLKILELEGSGTKLKINRFVNREIPFGIDSSSASGVLAEAIKSIFSEYHIEQDNLALTVPTQECVLREISVDFTDEAQIRQTIKYEAEKYLQSYEIDEVVVDYRKIESTEGKSRLFVSAVPKKILTQKLDILKQCNLDPIIVDLDIMALVNAARFCPAVAEKETVAIIDFGAGSTKIVILHKGKLKHMRAIRLGASLGDDKGTGTKETSISGKILPQTDAIDWDIENELIVSLPTPDGIDMDRMVLLKRDKQELTATSQRQKREMVFDRFIKEIKRTMLTIQLENPIDLICLTGGGSQIEGLLGQVKKTFGIDTVFLDFSQKIQTPPEMGDEMMVCSPALGLAIELLDNNSQSMNFRKEEFSYTNRFELVKLPLALLITMVFFFLLTIAFSMYTGRVQREAEYDVLIEKTMAIWKRIYGDQELDTAKFDKIYSCWEKLKNEQEELSQGGVPPVPDGLARTLILLQAFGKTRNRRYMTIDKYSLQPQECVFEGESQDDESLDILMRSIHSITNEIDPDQNKTRVVNTSPNTNPSDKDLARRYRFQVGFKTKE